VHRELQAAVEAEELATVVEMVEMVELLLEMVPGPVVPGGTQAMAVTEALGVGLLARLEPVGAAAAAGLAGLPQLVLVVWQILGAVVEV
jgi:hypothetical protein